MVMLMSLRWACVKTRPSLDPMGQQTTVDA